MKVEPKDIQIGDRVDGLGGTVTKIGTRGDVGVRLDGGTYATTINKDELAHAEITRPPKPLAVGDPVRWTGHAYEWRILHIIGDLAWIRTEDFGGNNLAHLHALTRIEESTT